MLKYLFAALLLFLSLSANAKEFRVPSFSSQLELDEYAITKVTAFLHVFCSFDGRKICDIDNESANFIVVGSIDQSGTVSFPDFTFNLNRPPGCSFILANCKPHLNINIYFTQYEFNQELRDRVLDFQHGFSPFKPKGHTVLNSGHYALNRSKFSTTNELNENLDYFAMEYLPYVRLFELKDGEVGYEYFGPISEF